MIAYPAEKRKDMENMKEKINQPVASEIIALQRKRLKVILGVMILQIIIIVKLIAVKTER